MSLAVHRFERLLDRAGSALLLVLGVASGAALAIVGA
jgi:hypothetical protein